MAVQKPTIAMIAIGPHGSGDGAVSSTVAAPADGLVAATAIAAGIIIAPARNSG
jgi:hypothetical protein